MQQQKYPLQAITKLSQLDPLEVLEESQYQLELDFNSLYSNTLENQS